jgi:hypothetical protein
MTTITQHAVDAMIETAYQTKLRHGYTATACVGVSTKGSRIGSLGFHFDGSRDVGDVVENEDGTKFKVLALV